MITLTKEVVHEIVLAKKSNYQNIHNITLAKYIWKDLNNLSNKICINEIRIRQELPVVSKFINSASKQLLMTLNKSLLYVLWLEENCQISPNKNKSPNLWHVKSILVCYIFGWGIYASSVKKKSRSSLWNLYMLVCQGDGKN